MKNIGWLFAVAVALASSSGCKKKGDDVMGKMGEFKERMCACKDKDCVMGVQKELKEFESANKDLKEGKTFSDEDMRKFVEYGHDIAQCATKAGGGDMMMGGGSAAAPAPTPAEGSGSAAAPAPAPAGSGSAPAPETK